MDDSMTNPMPTPVESVMAMFLMSLTNFGDYFSAFERTDHEFEAKVKLIHKKIIFKTFHNFIATFCDLYGNCWNITSKHVNCYDG